MGVCKGWEADVERANPLDAITRIARGGEMTDEETNKAIDDAARFGTGVLIRHGGGSSMTHIDLRDFYKPIMDGERGYRDDYQRTDPCITTYHPIGCHYQNLQR